MMATYYLEEEGWGLPPKHRLAHRPWHTGSFDQLPRVANEKVRKRRQSAQHNIQEARIAFQSHLNQTYGNEVRAWRKALAPKDSFTLTLFSLRRFCTKTRADVDIPALWKWLDRDNSMDCGMEELCPEAGAVLASFLLWARATCESCVGVWDTAEAHRARTKPRPRPGSSEGSNRWSSAASRKRMMYVAFIETLEELGWPGTENKCERNLLVSSLDSHGCGFVSRSDLQWLDGWKPPPWLCAERDPEALGQLRQLIRRKYGNMLFAWRSLFDRDDSNYITWEEFCKACRSLGFKGNVAAAWRELDTDLSGHITMREFDPESAETLVSFKLWAERHFGSVELAFHAIDADGSQSITMAELSRMCQKLKWPRDVKMLFDCLDIDDSRDDALKRALSYKELAFLDTWGTAEVAPLVVENNSLKASASSPSLLGSADSSVELPTITPSPFGVSPAEDAGGSGGQLEMPRSPGKADVSSFCALPQRTEDYAAFLASDGLATLKHESLHKWNHLVKAA
jgi:Ca2+-binding EF-hand superfamily protein